MKYHRLLAICLFFIIGCSATPDMRSKEEIGAPKKNVAYIDDFVLKAPEGVLTAWIIYGIAHGMWHDKKYFEMNPTSKVYQYTYSEELFSRDMMAKLWPEIKKEHPGLSDSYLDALAYVMDSGFLSEYVWYYFWEQEWGTPPETLRLKEFSEWQELHLKGHCAETHVWVRNPDASKNGSNP
jgi:hypothetical protein